MAGPSETQDLDETQDSMSANPFLPRWRQSSDRRLSILRMPDNGSAALAK